MTPEESGQLLSQDKYLALEIPPEGFAPPIRHRQKFYTWDDIVPLISASGSGSPITVRVSAREFASCCDRLPRCSWTYTYATSELQISMPSAVHHAPVNAFHHLFVRDVIEAGLLTAEEERRVIGGAINSVFLEKRNGGISPGKKQETVAKQPDWSWRIQRGSYQNFPTMVVEVSFSQDTHNLRRDQYQWIEGSDGNVKCVILIDIVEDTEHRQAHRAHFQEDRAFLETDHKVINVRDMTVPPAASPASDGEFDIDFWVGPTSATLTAHFADSLEGQQFWDIMDTNANQPPPSLPIAALMNLQDGHDECAWALDLNVIRDQIERGRRELAWSRLLAWRAANESDTSSHPGRSYRGRWMVRGRSRSPING